ncbi:MAG: hypothetical protein ACM3X9_14340 [Bacillota bacterium]
MVIITTDYIVAALGIIVALAGYLARPTELGWFLLGFGSAMVVLGLLDLVFNHSGEATNLEP